MLNSEQLDLIVPMAGAICGALLWLSYFKRIDVLESELDTDIIIAFCIGFLTPTLALWIYYGLEISGFNFNGQYINDFIYSIFGVGVTEEISKLIGVLIVFKIIKKRINEPIDYLVFAGIVALGFSVRENFIYYNNYGSQIATGRTLISCLIHIINTSICVYGIYRFRLFNKGNKIINAVIGISIAVLSHGLFDFFLVQPFLGDLTSILATIVYLVGINFWLQMINNCVNFSPFFNYQKLASTTKLYTTIFTWYTIVLLLEFAYGYIYFNVHYALTQIYTSIIREGFLLVIVSIRASRLKINKRKYLAIKLQLPFYFTKNEDEDFKLLWVPIKIRGENEKEFQFIKYMGKDILIYDVTQSNPISNEGKKGRLLKKYFLKNDTVTYLIEIDNNDQTSNIYLLKPKTSGITFINGIYPIGNLYDYNIINHEEVQFSNISYKDLKYIHDVYII